MASPAVTPASPQTGAQPLPGGAQAGAGAAAGGASQAGGTAGKLARLAMDAQGIASDAPETAPMMREIQNQVRMATMKMIQMRQAAQQQTPAI